MDPLPSGLGLGGGPALEPKMVGEKKKTKHLSFHGCIYVTLC